MALATTTSNLPLLKSFHPSLTQFRSFSCTSQSFAKSTKQRLKFEHSAVPDYPYGPSQIYKQSNFGLYGTQKIRFGNMVSERNEIKTRRYWRPNVQFKRLWSESLQKMIKMRITTRVLRTVDKVGGLDEYLLGTKAARIKELGMGGWKLRWRILQTESVQERFRKQRQEWGLPPNEIELIGSDGRKITKAEVNEEIQKIDAEILKDGGVNMIGEEEAQAAEEGAGDGIEFMAETPAPTTKVLL